MSSFHMSCEQGATTAWYHKPWRSQPHTTAPNIHGLAKDTHQIWPKIPDVPVDAAEWFFHGVVSVIEASPDAAWGFSRQMVRQSTGCFQWEGGHNWLMPASAWCQVKRTGAKALSAQLLLSARKMILLFLTWTTHMLTSDYVVLPRSSFLEDAEHYLTPSKGVLGVGRQYELERVII